MTEASPSRAGIYVATAYVALLAAASAWALYRLASPDLVAGLGQTHATLASSGPGAALGRAQDAGVLLWLLVPMVGPLSAAILFLLLAPRSTVVEAPSPEAAADAGLEPAPPPDPSAPGLRLLAALQEEARLIDFVREDLDDYPDEQVGAAVRGIHASLRKALDERLTLSPVLEGEDGAAVEVPAGFDPASIRLTGNPTGEPPFRGVLRHGGWRAGEARLPTPSPGSDAGILAPAEVEVEEA